MTYEDDSISRMDYRLLGLPIAICWHFTTGFGYRSALRKIINFKNNNELRKNDEKLIDWELALVSTLHSAICIAFAIVILFDFEDDKVKGLSKWVEVSCLHSIGFFIYDAITCVFVKKEPTKDLRLYLVHHVVASSCMFMSFINEEYHYFCAIRLWSELSTPFLNLIWILKELKYDKSSKANVLNAFCFTISFFLCRYLSAWFYWIGIYEVHNSEDFKLSKFSSKIFLILPPIILDVLNIFWSFKIVNGLISLVKPKNAPKTA